MSIVIIGNFFFPTGSAPAARVRNLAEGFVANGRDVHVIATKSLEDCDYSENVVYKSPRFSVQFSGSLPRVNTGIWEKLKFIFLFYRNCFRQQRDFFEYARKSKPTLVVCYGRNYFNFNRIFNFCKRNSIPVSIDIVEYHSFSWRTHLFSPLLLDQYLSQGILVKRADFFIGITTELLRIYSTFNSNNILIPGVEIWQDAPRISASEIKPQKIVLTYVGSLIERDNPQMLFNIIRGLALKGVKLELNLVGNYDSNSTGKLWRRRFFLDELIGTCIFFRGRVSDSELRNILRESDGLILTRRADYSEICAFPTRLVEYLKTARPVFVSQIGDIPKYLRHRIDAILLTEDVNYNISQFMDVFSEPGLGDRVGMNGYEAGKRYFNVISSVKKLLCYLDRN